MDAAVNGTWLAYKWAIEDGDEAAKGALESLILNWPFDFHLFQVEVNEGESADAKLEEKILEFMVNIPLETERLRDFFGLEGKHLMMIVAKVRDVLREQKQPTQQPNPKEVHTWPAQSIQRCSVSRPMGWKGANHSVAQNPKFAVFGCGAPGELQAFVVLINFDVVAHNPKTRLLFVGPRASSKRSWF